MTIRLNFVDDDSHDEIFTFDHVPELVKQALSFSANITNKFKILPILQEYHTLQPVSN